MEILENKAVRVRTRTPGKFAVIPKHLVQPVPGGYEVTVYWGLDEMRVMRNLGFKNAPSPIERKYVWPGRYKPMGHQRTTAGFLTLHRRAFVFNEPGCVDADTEYLSPTGWRRIADYAAGDVAQYHPDTGAITFVTPEEFVKLPCPEMVRLKTKYGLDQMLSPEHRMLIHDNAADKHCVMSAAQVLAAHDDWHAGAQRFNARRSRSDTVGFAHMAIPTHFTVPGGCGIALTDAQLRLQVAVIADAHFPGHFSNNNNYCVVRLKRPRKIKRLHQLLVDAGVPYKAREQNTPTAKDFVVFTFQAPWRTKEFDTRFWACTNAQLAIVADEVVYWDGTARGGNCGPEFSSTVKSSADFVQYAWNTQGRTARLTAMHRSHYRKGVCYVVKARGAATPRGLLSLKNRTTSTMSVVPSTDGFKYCFRVPSTFLVFRRNGCVFASGNTAKTISALWAADYLMQRGEVRRCLIVCPLSIMHSAWIGDITNSVIHRSAIVAHHTSAARRIEMVQGDYEFVIINYEGLNLVADEVRADGRFDLVIVDEANGYSNSATRRWKSLAKILTPDTFLWMMTGTPAAQSPVHAYGLAKLVNPNGVPAYVTAWRDKVMHKITQFKWVAKHDAKGVVHAALQPAIRFTKAQCLDLPPVLKTTREVAMTAQQVKYYEKIKRDQLVVAAGLTISAVNKAAVVNKLLQVSCIEYTTPVLTDSGWRPIARVSIGDRLWDGVEWVSHGGTLYKGMRPVVTLDGVEMTAEHLVLTNSGWAAAAECLNDKSSERLNRAGVRLPDGDAATWHYGEHRDAMRNLDVPVRMWEHGGAQESVPAFKAPNAPAKLRVPSRERDAQNVVRTPLQYMDGHASPVPGSARQRLQKLRRTWHNGVAIVGAGLREFLAGHGRWILAATHPGAPTQRQGVLQGELPLGDSATAMQQHAVKHLAGHPQGAADSYASGSRLRATERHAEAAPAPWVAPTQRLDGSPEFGSPVYDILHCGPRNRFVVRGRGGELLIVHNCGAAYSEDGEVVEFDATPRMKLLVEIMEETDRKVIIFAMYRASIDIIVAYLRKHGYNTETIHGGVSATRRGEIINQFQNGDAKNALFTATGAPSAGIQVLVMQPQATAHGITLTAADTVVFFGPLMSVELYTQCIARADRQGQTSDKVTVIHIQSSPIEKKMFAAMDLRVEDHALLTSMFDEEMQVK